MVMHKVAAFVSRGVGAAQQLLTIDHPDAGWQIPAGTVEEGEEPDTAVRRELYEEARLANLALVQKLATFNQLTGDQRVMCQTVQLRATAAPDAPLLPYIFRRGWYVRQLAQQKGMAQVCYEERQYLSNQPGEVVLSWQGWVGDTAVAPTLIRHLYHCRPCAELPDEWFADPGDHGHKPWRLFWQPLMSAELVQGQQEWLDMVRGRLMICDQ